MNARPNRRLTGPRDSGPLRPDPMNPLVESAGVDQVFIGTEWPGPCRTTYRDGLFLCWQPFTTYERALEMSA